MKDLVSIVIVSWNGKQWLKKCLPSLLEQSYKRVEIILVDNNSSDNTVEWVKKTYPKVICITLPENSGFARANNIGYRASKGSFVLFLNNDVVVDTSFIKELKTAVTSDPLIAGAQSKLLLMDNPSVLDSIGAFLTPTGFLYHYGFMNKQKSYFDKQIDLYSPKGASMMFKREALESVCVNGDVFDNDAFAYFEETDLAHRIWLSGKKIVYAYRSVVYHKMGGTSTSMDNAFIQYHSFKNRIASFIKNVSFSRLIPLLCIHFCVIQIYAAAAVLKKKFTVSLAIQKAVLWNIIHIGTTLRKRSYIQQCIRKVSDDVIWPAIIRIPSLQYYLYQMQGKPYVEEQMRIH